MYLKKIIYLCFVGGQRQQIGNTGKSLSNFFGHSGLLRDGFFMPGSYQILTMPETEIRQNSNFPNFQYVSHTSVSNDLTVSTYDLQVKNKRTLADNPFGMWWKEKVWNEKGQSELTN
jgi:hypothetical protein